MSGATLDTGALIAIERGSRRMQALLDEAAVAHAVLAVPAGVVGQAWRGEPRQARLARFLRQRNVDIVPLDGPDAKAAGVLCGRAASDDVVDASVVLCARQRHHNVVTSDPGDLRLIDRTLRYLEP